MNTPSIQTAEELEDGSTKGLENILEHRDNIAAAAEDLDIDLGSRIIPIFLKAYRSGSDDPNGWRQRQDLLSDGRRG